jgi:penicillin-binding protein-related factor A (putative recombinase)
MSDNLGKQAERKIREWLDRPEDGYCFYRIPDQMTGFYMVARNIADFFCYKQPHLYFIESKATEHDRFDFSVLSDTQRNGLRKKAEIPGVYGLVIVLFATYKRAFVFNIKDIADLIDPETAELKIKSVNIKKIDKWIIPYIEIETIPSRKMLLDYTGDLRVPEEVC